MAKAVFTTKVNPVYEDKPEDRYHFPPTYLRQVEASIGDWIIYYEPRRSTGDLSSRGGRQAYFATARVEAIEPHPVIDGDFFAMIEKETYLDFSRAVPFREGEHYYEKALQKADGSTNKGAFGRAVRNLPDLEYELILQAGFALVIVESFAPTVRSGTINPRLLPELAEEGAEFTRPLVEQITSRPFRDRAFAKTVVDLYNRTCAVTGLQIINGGGRAEVQAAHIRPVERGGSDSVRNGVALSGTVHWMFDRGLISIDDDYSILVADGRLPDAAKNMIREDRKLILPGRDDIRPHKSYLKFHREKVFKG